MKTNKNSPNPNRKISSDIKINLDVRCDVIDFSRRKFADIIKKTTIKFGIKNAVINFAVVDDAEIISINHQFLKKKKITDVISFDLSDSNSDKKVFDIAVNAQLAQKQAEIKKHSGQAEIALYCLHGLLHQLGFDDLTAADAAKMHKTEDKILEEFGYGKVFSGR
ncbi:MAG TPA: rRNA maturation RNase YbeY [Phycisphaerales bacterium]|nr:MAG: rRNA maturation RNase YbeY [Planctomycetes bacterium GWC2_45_44]HBG78245.1 rRNA maturation RNase YbeY [Phycisphaerales bacterium]HBR18796.1 rRNA maturation RNase YbeY [Phycisphaerales bacterium]